MRTVLRLTVDYALPDGYPKDQAKNAVQGFLRNLAEHAYNEGLLFEATELQVDDWTCEVVVLAE